MSCFAVSRSKGLTLLDALVAVAILAVWLVAALPSFAVLGGRLPVVQARAAFESDWRSARWQAQRLGQVLRLQPLALCRRPGVAGGWHCGWQLVVEGSGKVLQESHLAPGVWVTSKPNLPWRIDAWGEPLSGGASMLFQAASSDSIQPEVVCMNVLGRLRRVAGDLCGD